MELFAYAIYAVAAGAAIVQSLLLLLQTWEHRRFARNRLNQLYRYRPTGRVMVFAPCKGVDIGLDEHLRRLLDQDYGDYAVTFIVESTRDPAYWLIRRLMVEHPRVQTRVVVAGLAAEGGQKIHNLRVATADLPPDVEYLAFIDSDARPRRQWLRALVSHLDLPKVGVATGYRWFVPVRPTLSAQLIYAVNCNVAVLARSRHPNLVWGGSWAVRRELYESLGIRDALEGMLTEDLVVTRVVQQNRLHIEFEPACMVASSIDGGFRQVFSFLRRQYVLGRYYVPTWWRVGVITSLSANVAFLLSLGMLAWGLASRTALAWIPAAALAAIYGLHVVRGYLRQSLVRVYFPDLQGVLRRPGRFDIWAGPVVSLANAAGLLSSLVGKQVTWRGITYRLSRSGQTRIVRRDSQPKSESEDDSGHPENDCEATNPPSILPFPFRKAG